MSQPKPDPASHGPSEVDSMRRWLRALLEAVPGAAAEVDAAGRIVACNRRFAALCGAIEADLAGKPLSSLALPDSVRLERRPLPPPVEGELVVAEERRLDEERERKLREAQRMESLSVLAGGVAHDFNNLLTGIIGYASLARRETTSAAGLDYLDRVLQSAQRAAELCAQMLAYSGRGRFVVEPLDLSQAVRDLAAPLQASGSRQATLSLELADGLPPVLADAAQLRQVVLNLVQNASEALGERAGSITVRTGQAWRDRAALSGACVDDDLPEGEYVFIEAADTGCGMDAETRRRAFEPFFTTKFTGRGLGLAAVLGVVRGHRGAIELTTAPGLGTTMRVWFPRAPEAPAAGAAAPASAAREGGAVLFVDDEPALRDLAVRTLRPAGYEALTAADGREALELLRARRGDVRVVVLDLTMPGLDADETLRALRSVRPNLPVILSSGYSESEASRRFAAGDLAGFLPKPYRPYQLLEKVRQALG